jgi:hypothetical protein
MFLIIAAGIEKLDAGLASKTSIFLPCQQYCLLKIQEEMHACFAIFRINQLNGLPLSSRYGLFFG